MSRYRLCPSPEQERAILGHCAHVRYVWNLAVEQQALRDFAQAMAGFFGGARGQPSWRKAGRDEGFRITGQQGKQWDVRRLNRHWGEVRVPKAGWIRFRWSRGVPHGVRSFRVTRDRAGRWHVAFTHIPDAVPAPGNGQVVGVDRGVAVSAALSTGETLTAPGLRTGEQRRLVHLDRKLARAIEAPGHNVAAKTRLNRGIHQSGWGLLARRLEQKAPGRVERVDPAFTSQRCSACELVDRKSCESQAVGPGNREPQLLLQSA